SMYNKYLKCYYCEFSTDSDLEYQKHVEQKDPSKPVYPTIRQIQEYGLKPQDKIWEDQDKIWEDLGIE
ncbi:MAG: hypothetical protein ACRD97_12770, partial [Nitrososphaeraceae archaeon]